MKRKGIIITVLILVFILLAVLMIKLIGSWGKNAATGQDTVTVTPSVYIEKKRCKYNDDLEKKLRLPRSTATTDAPLSILSDRDNFLVKEIYIDTTSDEEKERSLYVDGFGGIKNIYYNIDKDSFFKNKMLVARDSNFKAVTEETAEEDMDPDKFLFHLDKGKVSENFNKFEIFGNFFKGYVNLKDNYGPLFTKTEIFNKEGKSIYEFTDNVEKPVDVKLTPDNNALIVNEFLRKYVINESGKPIEIPFEVKENYGYNLVWYEDELTEDEENRTYILINIKTLEKKTIKVPKKQKINALSFNVYEIEDENKSYVVNGSKITNGNEIKRIDRVLSDSPLLLSCAVTPPGDVKDVGDYFALFKVTGDKLKKSSRDFTEIITDNNLYKPMDNVFYGRDRRENTEGGFFRVIDYDANVILDEKAEILEITPNGYVVKGVNAEMVYNKKTKSLYPSELILRMVKKDLNGYENKRYSPEK